MKFPCFIVAIAVSTVMVPPLHAGPRGVSPFSPMGPPSPYDNISSGGPEPPIADVVAGSSAPDFSYQLVGPRWHHLHDLLDQGAVLLVFAPGEKELKRIEHERPALLQRGVVPVAVVELRSGVARDLVRRLRLGFTVISDPRDIISLQFNVLDETTRTAVPAWFVVDRSGRVRGLARGRVPESGYLGVVAESLSLPSPGVARPISH